MTKAQRANLIVENQDLPGIVYSTMAAKKPSVIYAKDDLLSVAYLALVKASERFDPERTGFEGRTATFRTYAEKVIYYAMIDYLRSLLGSRSKLKTPRSFVQIQEGDLVADAPDVGRRQAFEVVLDHVRRLPEEDQQIVRWYYFEGMFLRQIGEQFGISESAACNRLKKVTRKLRRSLAQEGHGPELIR